MKKVFFVLFFGLLTSFAFANNAEKTILPEKVSDSRNLSLTKSLTWDEKLGTCTAIITIKDANGEFVGMLVYTTDYIYSEEGCAIWAQAVLNNLKRQME